MRDIGLDHLPIRRHGICAVLAEKLTAAMELQPVIPCQTLCRDMFGELGELRVALNEVILLFLFLLLAFG